MKRNLNAIIALVLVVVMVFPMSIFVGAAGEALTAKQSDGTAFASGGTLKVPTENTKALTFTVPTGYSNLKATKETDNAASTVKVSNNTVTFTGAMVGKTDTYKVTATKGSGSTLSTLSFTVKVEAVDIATEGDITVSCKKNIDDPTFAGYAPGATISKADFKVEGKLNTGAAVTFTIEGIKLAGEEYTDTVVAKGGDTAISVKYKITNAGVKDPERTADNVAIVVLGQKLTINTVALNKTQPYTKTDSITPATLKNFLTVTVSEAGSSSTVTGFAVKLMKGTQEDTSITYAEALLGGYELIVTYKGVEKKLNLFDAALLFDTTVPNDVKLKADDDRASLTKTDFYAGEKIEEITKTTAKRFFDIWYIASKDPDADSSATDVNMTEDVDVTISSFSISAFVSVDKPLTVTMVVNGKTLTCEVTPKQLGITKLKERAVTGIQLSSTKSTMKTTYAEGDVLDLNGLWIDLVYDYGDPKPVQYGRDFTCDPGAGTVLNKSIKSLRVNYTDPDTEEIFTCTIPLTITAAERKVKEVQVVNASAIKNEYYIGEALDVNGLVLMVMYTDNFYEYKTLTSSTKPTVISASYQNGKFTAAYSGSLEISLDITYNKADSTATKTETVTVTIPSVTVTKRPTLVSITATSDKKEYLEGESPKICDFRITAKYDNGDTRDFEVAENNANAAKTTASFTSGNVTYTIKLTPTVISDTTDYVRVSFTEKVTGSTTTTKTFDFEIDVIIPDAILSYYDTSLSKTVQASYEDLYDALEEAQDRYDSRYPSRVPKIILCRDVAMISDFDTIVPMDIDLNGHTLTMIRGELYVYSGAGATVEVDFFNTAKADAKLVYSDDDEDTVIIAYNDSYIIDRDTDSDGKYDVSITTPKNGKVTGPKEVTHGHDAVFTLTPDDGYSISSVKVNSKTVTVPADGKLTISNVQEKLTITVTFVEMEWDNPFTDVYKSAAYYKSVQFVYEKELFQGMSANKFEPNTTMTRAMFVTVLGRLAGIDADTAAARYGYSSTFTDVSSTDQSIRYAVPYIKWATDNGLIEGYGDGKFGPKDDITHAQMYVLMQRYALLIEQQNTSAAGTAISAKDTSSIPDWAYSAVEYASKKNFLIMSSTKHLTPNGDATRAELAQLLEKFCTNVLGE